jgi:enoyl-CoA hydratase
MQTRSATLEIRRETSPDGVLTVTMDDGKRNALTPEAFEGLIAVLDEENDARAVVLTGREGVLTAGLDIKWMAANGRDGVHDLLVGFGQCLMRWWTDPRPTVCAAAGHAIAAGTMFGMVCDHAVAAEGHWWGLTETQIDFEMPEFGIVLARHNVRADRLEDVILPGTRIDAAAAVEVGYADELASVEEVLPRAVERARELAELPARAYGGTKRRLRDADARAVLAGLDADIGDLTRHMPAS